MKNRTITVTLATDRDAVFNFLKHLENLPVWAPGFCTSLRRVGAHWLGVTPTGEAFFTLVTHEPTGVIDLFFGAHADEMNLVPLRVMRAPHGAVIVGTFFQPVDWTQELYEWHCEILVHALRGLTQRFGGGEVQIPRENGGPFYPSLVTAKFFETWDFYTSHLGFRTACECDVYVRLVHPSGAQIGVLRHELIGPSPELVSATEGRGFWLSLDVADADAEYARLSAAGAAIVTPVEDKPWGERQFVVRDPNGVLIAIAHRYAVRGMESRPLAN